MNDKDKLIPESIQKILIEQHSESLNNPGVCMEKIHKPYLKLIGGLDFTCLISEYDQERDMLYGLFDLGRGYELCRCSLTNLIKKEFHIHGIGHRKIERDKCFKPKKTLWEYYVELDI